MALQTHFETIQSFIAYLKCYVIDLSNKSILVSMKITVTPESDGEKGHLYSYRLVLLWMMKHITASTDGILT